MVFELTLDMDNLKGTLSVEDSTLKLTSKALRLYATDIDGNLLGYELSSIVLRTPSEHTIDDDFEDMEMQLHFKLLDAFKKNVQSSNQTVRDAMVGIFIHSSSSAEVNPFLRAFSDNLGSNGSLRATNVNSFLTASVLRTSFVKDYKYYSYRGSFTAPPCTKNVNWYVLEDSWEVLSTQVDTLMSFLKAIQFGKSDSNARNTQPSNNRLIKKGGEACQEQFTYFFGFLLLFIAINYFVFKLL
jgi:carbonic anhydrase